jgi:predicted N-acetyltransferase YhbS
MSTPAYVIRPESSLDADAIERLHDRAFGPGRYARTAYRLREDGGEGAGAFSYAAFIGTFLVGSIRMTRATAGGLPVLVLGPLTVDPSFEGLGIGSALMRQAIAAAAEAGEQLVLLVGDLPYYQRFGFRPVPQTGKPPLRLPGPVDPARFLGLELTPGALERAHGTIQPRL